MDPPEPKNLAWTARLSNAEFKRQHELWAGEIPNRGSSHQHKPNTKGSWEDMGRMNVVLLIVVGGGGNKTATKTKQKTPGKGNFQVEGLVWACSLTNMAGHIASTANS